jgi:DNA ligase (NAD+)|tara:strand:+ start:2846 stop:3787 length:942 start_codon:yes stop_codon:yes gene_type:complete
MENLRKILDKASEGYYAGVPTLSDEEFDRLAEIAQYAQVGSPSGRVPHAFPMYSLQKIFTGDKSPISGYENIVVTPKLDGSAVSLLYVDGNLTQVLTRGDGKRGLDITDKFLAWDSIPKRINVSMKILQVTGEVVAPKSVPNSRNYAAGALNLKDIPEFLSRDLFFIAYGLEPCIMTHWTKDMNLLQSRSFSTVLDEDWAQFPHDGTVWRLDENEKFRDLGYTSHHPRGAYALKEQKEGVITTLLDVIWQVGKSGVVSPVAILEPCVIGEATVSRATLHNKAYIEALGLYIGCRVEVIRSGEIIPRIVGLAEK